MGRSLRPSRVYQTVKTQLSIPRMKDDIRDVPPVWLKVIERIPPSEILTRPKPTPHRDPDLRQRRPRNIFRPQTISFPEDELRRIFFKDHPWELARPRVAVELDGKDARFLDWSTGLRQRGMQVTGESVVQRQLWLMENGIPEEVMNEATGDKEIIHKPCTREQAYDHARRDFYLIRQSEEIERRIALEEARMVGAYFGKNRLQVSLEIEDKTYESWKRWAQAETSKIQSARESAYANFGSDDADKDLSDVLPEEEEVVQ